MKPSTYFLLPKALKSIRDKLCLKQRHMADHMEVEPNTYNGYEKANIIPPTDRLMILVQKIQHSIILHTSGEVYIVKEVLIPLDGNNIYTFSEKEFFVKVEDGVIQITHKAAVVERERERVKRVVNSLTLSNKKIYD